MFPLRPSRFGSPCGPLQGSLAKQSDLAKQHGLALERGETGGNGSSGLGGQSMLECRMHAFSEEDADWMMISAQVIERGHRKLSKHRVIFSYAVTPDSSRQHRILETPRILRFAPPVDQQILFCKFVLEHSPLWRHPRLSAKHIAQTWRTTTWVLTPVRGSESMKMKSHRAWVKGCSIPFFKHFLQSLEQHLARLIHCAFLGTSSGL